MVTTGVVTSYFEASRIQSVFKYVVLIKAECLCFLINISFSVNFVALNKYLMKLTTSLK